MKAIIFCLFLIFSMISAQAAECLTQFDEACDSISMSSSSDSHLNMSNGQEDHDETKADHCQHSCNFCHAVMLIQSGQSLNLSQLTGLLLFPGFDLFKRNSSFPVDRPPTNFFI